MKQNGLGKNLLAIVVIVVAVAMGVNNGLKQSARAELQRDSERAKEQLSQLQLKAQRQLKDQGYVDDDLAKEMQGVSSRLAASMEKSSAALGGSDAKFTKAASELMRDILAIQKPYDEAVAKIEGLIDVSAVASLDEIKERQTNLAAFEKAAEATIAGFKGFDDHARKRLAATGLSSSEVDLGVKEFMKSFSPRRDAILKIRRIDLDVCVEFRAILDLLESTWGAWRWDAEEEMVVWTRETPDAVADSYIAANEKIAELVERQAEAQGALMRMR